MADGLVELAAGDYRLALEPARGGSIARFDWRGEPLMRPTGGPSILDVACFPLVPFSNRIAWGRFTAGGREARLPRNFPSEDHPHAIHGFGWQAPWTVTTAEPTWAVLRHRHEAGDWPWAYEAEQVFTLSEAGLHHLLRVRNMSDEPMPAGLGLHPYFPRDDRTIYQGLHRGEWKTAADGLPVTLREADEPTDWWRGAPVSARSVDTVYADRSGPLTILWPERATKLVIEPSPNLAHTVVYTPPDKAFFCVEPVSHLTDALNRPGQAGMHWLQQGEAMNAHVSYTALPT